MSLLSRVTSTAHALPSRVFLYAREKWGKSSLFAHAPGAIFFMTRGETGLTELIAGGRVPPTAHFEYDEQHPPTWATLRQAVRELAAEEHPHKALVIDTCNGAEILCQEHVRKTQFGNDHKKFASYGKGWETCRVEWLALLQDLDALRSRRKMSVVFLAHTKVKKFDDPTQEEGYDKYQPACQEKLWDLTHKWADIICFGHFRAETYESDSGKLKARADLLRVLCFDPSPVWEAGNRYGIAGELNVGGGAKAGFAAFAAAVAKAKAATAPPPPPAPRPAAPPTPPEDTEGEQRADPTHPPAATTPPATTSPRPTATAPAAPPTTPTTPYPTDPTPNELRAARERLAAMLTPVAYARVWATLPEAVRARVEYREPAEPAPAPADDRVRVGGNLVQVLLKGLHELELSWSDLRDRATPKAVKLADAARLPVFGAADRINTLFADDALRLHQVLETAVELKKENAATRAANKARREAELATEGVTAS